MRAPLTFSAICSGSKNAELDKTQQNDRMSEQHSTQEIIVERHSHGAATHTYMSFRKRYSCERNNMQWGQVTVTTKSGLRQLSSNTSSCICSF